MAEKQSTLTNRPARGFQRLSKFKSEMPHAAKANHQSGLATRTAMTRQISYGSNGSSPSFVPVHVENMDEVQTEELQTPSVPFIRSDPHLGSSFTYGRNQKLKLHPNPTYEDNHCRKFHDIACRYGDMPSPSHSVLSPRIPVAKRFESVNQPKVVFGSSQKRRITSFPEEERGAPKSDEICGKLQNVMKRPQTAGNLAAASPKATQHRTFKAGRFYAGGPARVGGTQNHTITNAQPDSGLKITSLSQSKSLRRQLTSANAISPRNVPGHAEHQKRYLVKYSQLPTNEFLKLKLMADDLEKDKDKYLEESTRQMNEFKALKVKHLTTVSDRRAVMPKYEQEKHLKMKRQNSMLSKGIKSAKTMALRKVALKDMIQSTEAMHEAGTDGDIRAKLMLAGASKPVHGPTQSRARLAAREHVENVRGSYCSRQSCRESQNQTKAKANPMFKVEAVDGTPAIDKATSAAYLLGPNADLPDGACLNDDDNDPASGAREGKVTVDLAANTFYQVPEPNFSPKFVITGPPRRGGSPNTTRNDHQVALSQQLFQMPDFDRKEDSEDEKSKSTAWDQKQHGTIEPYFLWKDMKPNHRRKIAHYQTLKYPIKSDEGRAFGTLVRDPELINQYARKYGPDPAALNPAGTPPLRQIPPYPLGRMRPGANISTELGSHKQQQQSLPGMQSPIQFSSPTIQPEAVHNPPTDISLAAITFNKVVAPPRTEAISKAALDALHDQPTEINPTIQKPKKRRRRKATSSWKFTDHQTLFDNWYNQQSKRLRIHDIQKYSKVLEESRGRTMSQVRSMCAGRTYDQMTRSSFRC